MARKRSRDHEAEDDRPWTEEQWEKMMKESDLRAARFGELLETMQNEPDRDVKVAREMGWKELADDLERHPRDENGKILPLPGEEEEAAEIERTLAEGDFDEDDSDDDDDGLDLETPPLPPEDQIDTSLDGDLPDPHGRRRKLRQIPAYRICERVSDLVREALDPYQKDEKLDDTVGELFGETWIGIHISCAKISGGHAMGYDDDVLCGNIVNNKRALAGAQQSLNGFRELGKLGVLPKELVDRVVPHLEEAIAAIESRIAEMRKRVWWA